MALLDKLAFLLNSRGDKFDKSLKWHSLKMRSILAAKGLMGGKNQVVEGGTNFTVSQIKLQEWLPWRKLCHICPKTLVYHTSLKLC